MSAGRVQRNRFNQLTAHLIAAIAAGVAGRHRRCGRGRGRRRCLLACRRGRRRRLQQEALARRCGELQQRWRHARFFTSASAAKCSPAAAAHSRRGCREAQLPVRSLDEYTSALGAAGEQLRAEPLLESLPCCARGQRAGGRCTKFRRAQSSVQLCPAAFGLSASCMEQAPCTGSLGLKRPSDNNNTQGQIPHRDGCIAVAQARRLCCRRRRPCTPARRLLPYSMHLFP